MIVKFTEQWTSVMIEFKIFRSLKWCLSNDECFRPYGNSWGWEMKFTVIRPFEYGLWLFAFWSSNWILFPFWNSLQFRSSRHPKVIQNIWMDHEIANIIMRLFIVPLNGVWYVIRNTEILSRPFQWKKKRTDFLIFSVQFECLSFHYSASHNEYSPHHKVKFHIKTN